MPDRSEKLLPTRRFDGSDDPLERGRWFYSSRVNIEGKTSSRLLASASAQRHRQEQKAKAAPSAGVNWTPIGPSVVAHGQPFDHGRLAVSGRITALAVGPDGSRVYSGAANGGIWFSPDGGTSWVPLDNYSTSSRSMSHSEDAVNGADSLAVGAVAVRFGASETSDIIFVGTGEPIGGDSYFGIGIRYSPNSGIAGTWALEATNLAGHAIYKIVIDPTDAKVVYAATSQGLYQRPISSSVTDWDLVKSPIFAQPTGTVSDVIVVVNGTSKLYYAAYCGDHVYRSSDGITWSQFSGVNGAKRIVLAAGENDPTVVYALGDKGNLYRLDSGTGSSFRLVSGVPRALFVGNRGDYAIVLAVDPADANTVYMGGDCILDQGDFALSFYKGTITCGTGSYTFPFNSANDLFTNDLNELDSSRVPSDPTWIGRNIHADVHAIAFAAKQDGTHDGTIVWVGTDGGPYQSQTGGIRGSFISRSIGLAITQMTYIVQHPDTDAVLFGGCQDNGALRFWGEQAWTGWVEGDGGGVAIDPHNPYQVMQQYTNTILWTSTDGGVTCSQINFPPVTITDSPEQQDAANFESQHTNFYAPIATSPKDVLSTLAVFGTYRLWLTANWGATWVTLPTGTNPYSHGIPDYEQDSLDDDSSAVCAVVFASGMRIFAATQKNVWCFDCNGTSWTKKLITDVGLPLDHWITALAVEIDNPANCSLYVTLGGYGHDHLWYFNGDGWQSALSTSIIDAPAHAVVVDLAKPQDVYVGTDVGCWHGSKTSASTWFWEVFSQGLPESAITDLKIHTQARLLRAATHGRGVWEILLDNTPSMASDIYMRLNYADSGRLQNGARFPWVDGIQDPNSPSFKVSHSMSPDIKVRRGSIAGLSRLSTQPDYLEFATIIGDQIDKSTNIETADATGTNRIFIQVHNRGLTPVAGNQVQVLLLFADASVDLPNLPTDYATSINVADTNDVWLAGTRWTFADPTRPYRNLPSSLDVRTPQVVEYDVDFSALAMAAGHNRVCAAAFVTTTIDADKLSSTDTNLDELTMHDKHVAYRTLLLL